MAPKPNRASTGREKEEVELMGNSHNLVETQKELANQLLNYGLEMNEFDILCKKKESSLGESPKKS